MVSSSVSGTSRPWDCSADKVFTDVLDQFDGRSFACGRGLVDGLVGVDTGVGGFASLEREAASVDDCGLLTAIGVPIDVGSGSSGCCSWQVVLCEEKVAICR